MKNKPGLSARELIVETLREKSFMKQEIYERTVDAFGMVKTNARALIKDLAHTVNSGERKLEFNYKEKGDYEVNITIAGDTLVFHMHSNVFNFERSHFLWNTSYLKDDETRGYCGVINIYNFLTDSFTYNRENDLGYLIARIFINRDNHYFVEGKRQLGFLYNDFPNAEVSSEALKNVMESAILYALDFDLLMPNYDQVKQVTISEIFAASDALQQRTGKRLGFRFQADIDEID